MTAVRRMLSTREGSLVLAIVAAVAAAATLMAFLHGYKHSLNANAQPVTVLVAKQPLPKGSSGDLIAKKGLYQATGFKPDQVKDGAITDPGSLSGVVANHDIVRGQQLTTADFSKPSDPVLSKLDAADRAISVPLDDAHGLIGRIEAGDHVDVYSGFEVQPDGAAHPRPVLRTLLQNVEVLEAPPATTTTTTTKTLTPSSTNQTQDVILKVPEKVANEVAFAVDNGKVWVVLRPQTGATQSAMSLVTLDRLLVGLPPIAVDQFGGRKRQLVDKISRGGF